MRISDVERERVVEELRRHLGAGRLDLEEYSRRIEEAMAASSFEDLDRARRDLPMVRIPDPSAARRAGPPVPDVQAPAWRWVLTPAVVAGGVALGVGVDWVWGVLLVGGWALGRVQSIRRT